MEKIESSLNVGLFLPEARLHLRHTQNKQTDYCLDVKRLLSFPFSFKSKD